MRLQAAAFCVLILTANTALAATFTAGVACNGPFQENVGSGPVNNSCLNPLPLGGITPLGSAEQLGTASSSVSPFAMHLSSTAIVDVTGGTAGSASIANQAWGIWQFNDFLVTGTGSQSVPVLGALHLALSGTIAGGGTGDAQGPLTAFANGVGQIFFEIHIDGSFVGFGEATYAHNNGSPIETVEGLLIGHYGTGGTISDSITTSQLTLPVGQTFDVEVYVNAGARGFVGIGGTPADQFDTVSALGGGISDFSTTVTFPTSGPVFDLPPGFTLNAPSAGIIDNRLVVNQVVPEPATASLLALGGGLLVAVKRSRDRRRNQATAASPP